jgi:hypothetical protein
LGKRSVGWPDYEVKTICAARIVGKSDAELKALIERLHSLRATRWDSIISDALKLPATPRDHAEIINVNPGGAA